MRSACHLRETTGSLRSRLVDCLLPNNLPNRLLDPRTQERYYAKIVERYMSFCSDAGRGDELLRRLARLDVNQTRQPEKQPEIPQRHASLFNSTANLTFNGSGKKDVSTLMMSMRKLREGIVALNRIDDFSIQAYIFCIRLSILMKQWEAYTPALLFLLHRMHKKRPLSSVELQEFVGYQVLDLACREKNLAAAHAIKMAYGLQDSKVDTILRALTYDNYYLFWKVRKSVDGHKLKLMEYMDEEMRRHALKCLGRSYLNIDLSALEKYTDSSWASLVKDQGVGWDLEGTKVVIRRPKAR